MIRDTEFETKISDTLYSLVTYKDKVKKTLEGMFANHKLAQASTEDERGEEQLLLRDRNAVMRKARIKQLYKEKKLSEAYGVFLLAPAQNNSNGGNNGGGNGKDNRFSLSMALLPQVAFMAKSLIDAQDFVLKQKEQAKYQTKHVFINTEIPEEIFYEDEVMKAFKRNKYPLVATTTTS